MSRSRWPRPGVVVALTLLPGLLLPCLFGASLTEFARLRGRMPRQIANFGEVGVKEGELVAFFMREKLRRLSQLPARAAALDVALEGHRWAQDAVRIELPRRSREALEADLPRSGETYQPAAIWEHGVRYPLKLRFRGNTIRHWLYPRRSLKARTKKGRLVRGRRGLNFTVKDPYRLSFSQALARESGLLAPDVDPVRVFVNGRLAGIMAAVQEVDEGFLLDRRRMPGDVYKGENWLSDNEYRYGSPPCWLFRDPSLWTKSAFDNTRPEHDMRDLELLTRLTSSPEEAARRGLERLLDRATLVRHWAYKLLLGEFHQGDNNNQKWYLDPTDGRFYPVVWDPLIRDGSVNLLELRKVHRGVHFSYSPTILPAPYHRLAADPRLVHEALREVLEGLPTRSRVDEIADELNARALRHEAAEPAGEPNPTFASSTEQLDSERRLLRANRDRLERLLKEGVALQWQAQPGGVWLGARGLAGVQLRALEVVAGELPSAAPLQDLDRDGVQGASDRPLQGAWEKSAAGRARFVLSDPILILPAYVGLDRLLDVPRAYPLLLPAGVEIKGVEASNALTGAPAKCFPLGEWNREDVDAEHPWDLQRREGQAPAAERVLDGPLHRIESDLVIPAGQTLRIRKGTRILLGPDVSVICRGRLLAEGTEAAPIHWGPSDPTRPWGVLALQGPGASGSQLRHLRFQGGSRARLDRVRYPGMVDLHHVRGVEIEACRFSANRFGDDALRLAHSEAEVRDCEFVDVPGDAIDMDYSSGLVTGCRFERVGNDGVDLMRSAPRLVGNTFSGCGDKGISIGEGSEPLVADSTIEGCEIGIQIKDTSEPLLLHLEIRGSKTGVLVSKKNWRYGRGGGGWLQGCRVQQNGRDLAVEEDSRLWVSSSQIGDPPRPTPSGLLLSESAPEKPDPEGALRRLATQSPPNRVGVLGRQESAWRWRKLLLEHRFPDGFRLVSHGWSAEESQLYVQRAALVAKVNPNLPLRLRCAPRELPPGARVHLLVSADDPCTLRLSLDGVAGQARALGPVPVWITRDVQGRTLSEVSLVPSKGTRVRIHRYQETGE